MEAWPAYAQIVAPGLEAGSESDVERTPFDDGQVAQRRLQSTATETLQVQVLLDDDDAYSEFRAWARTHAHGYFEILTPTGAESRARVRGGAAGIRYRALIHPGPRRRWEAQLTLEGPNLT